MKQLWLANSMHIKKFNQDSLNKVLIIVYQHIYSNVGHMFHNSMISNNMKELSNDTTN